MSERPNKIVTFSTYGGIIGFFSGDESAILKKILARENDSGWRYRSHTGTAPNLAAIIIRVIILFFTFLLWTLGQKHILVLERMENENLKAPREFDELEEL